MWWKCACIDALNASSMPLFSDRKPEVRRWLGWQALACHGSCLTRRQTRLKTTMNLSSYLQMPPAPLVPTSPATTAPQGARAGASPSAGASLGVDFAQVMASQMQRLVPLQRQMIAAETPSSQQPRPQTQSRAQEDQQQVDDQRSTQRLDAEARDAHISATHDAGQEQTTDQPPSHAHQRARAATPKTNAADLA